MFQCHTRLLIVPLKAIPFINGTFSHQGVGPFPTQVWPLIFKFPGSLCHLGCFLKSICWPKFIFSFWENKNRNITDTLLYYISKFPDFFQSKVLYLSTWFCFYPPPPITTFLYKLKIVKHDFQQVCLLAWPTCIYALFIILSISSIRLLEKIVAKFSMWQATW